MYPTSEAAEPSAPARPAASGLVPALVAELRPRQWLKNGLVFFGLIYSLNLTNPELLARAMLAFVVFSLLASVGYILNDFRDLEADRLHPTKRRRPLASGQLPHRTAAAAAVALLAGGLSLGLLLGPLFVGIGLGYLALTALYSVSWKHLVIIDLFCISGGFVLRVVAGSVAVSVGVSPWLYICTILGSLLIALGKRRSEILDLSAEDALAHRPALEHYTVEFLDRLIVVTASAAVMAYSLYTVSAENVPPNHSMMLTVPVVIYGVFRYLYLVQGRGLGGSPEELLLADHNLAVAVALFLVLSAGILYLSPR